MDTARRINKDAAVIVCNNGVVEVSLVHVWWWNFDLNWVKLTGSR